MPTLTLNKNLFLEKIGEKLSDEQLEKILPLIKLEVEEIGEDEIKVEVTPDRPDMFFLDGIARTLKCFLGKESGIYQTIFDVPKIEVKIDVKSVERRKKLMVKAYLSGSLSNVLLAGKVSELLRFFILIGKEYPFAATIFFYPVNLKKMLLFKIPMYAKRLED